MSPLSLDSQRDCAERLTEHSSEGFSPCDRLSVDPGDSIGILEPGTTGRRGCGNTADNHRMGLGVVKPPFETQPLSFSRQQQRADSQPLLVSTACQDLDL